MRFTRKGAALFALTIIFITFPLVSAEILISQPKSLYNFGDEFFLTITVKPQAYVSGYLTATLSCPTGDVELYRSPISIKPDAEKEIEISTNLDSFLVSGIEGECYVKAQFVEETSATPKFQLSRRVIVTMNINGPVYDPGATVVISGEAKKENSQPLEGFAEVSVPGIEFTHTSTVKSGQYNFSFLIPEDAPANSYNLEIKAYEKDSLGEIINEGTTSNVIRINQVVEEAEVAFKEQTIVPTQDISYTVFLYDQSKTHALADVSIEIYNPDNTLYKKLIVRSDEPQTIDIETNFPPGYWNIKAKYNDLITERDFLIEEYKDISFSLENETLAVKNTGNVPYTGPVEVKIGDTSEIRDIKDLKVGEVKKFKLKAPNGEYPIGVGKGTERSDLGTAFLTGNAVSVDDVSGSFGGRMFILLGLVIVLAVAIVLVLLYKKRRGGMLIQSSSDKVAVKASEQKAIEKGALTTLIDRGEKQESSILVLNLKNLEELQNTDAIKSIDSALWKVKEAGAKIYTEGNFRIAIFSPILTKEKDNTLKAAGVAQMMERMLVAYNRHSKVKIDFGIALHEGTLIVENKEGGFRFMSLNNIVGSTKKISQESQSDILISEAFHNKTVGKIKATKIKDKKIWKVDRVIDRSEHAEYIKNFSLKNSKR